MYDLIIRSGYNEEGIHLFFDGEKICRDIISGYITTIELGKGKHVFLAIHPSRRKFIIFQVDIKKQTKMILDINNFQTF